MYIPSSVSTPRAPARELIPAQPKTRDIGGKRYHKLRNVAGEGTLNKTFSLECKLRFLTSRPHFCTAVICTSNNRITHLYPQAIPMISSVFKHRCSLSLRSIIAVQYGIYCKNLLLTYQILR